MRPLYGAWKAAKLRLDSDNPNGLKDFTQRLVRRLSVETGILERIYDLDLGTTEALVRAGFMEELVSRNNTNIEPSRLIDILRDHEAAIQLVIDCVAKARLLTISVVHELHAILTKHQDTTTAVDPFGTRLEISLLRGEFKKLPNNPRRHDGFIHEYCPPIHVASEMDNLLDWLADYQDDDPIIVSAWFHRRFAQIHPYQDGNGRLARALTTLILLRAELLPLVIDRDLRSEYIAALELADQGDLSSIAALFARLERAAILQALSWDADAEASHRKTIASAVIGKLADKFNKRKQVKQAELRGVNELAVALRGIAHSVIFEALEKLAAAVSAIAHPRKNVTYGGPDHENAHWYKFEVVKSANAGGKFANFTESHYFLKASIGVERDRLVFVTSFHHVGRELSGIMEATAFAKLGPDQDSKDQDSVPEDFFVCSLEPFVFTYRTSVDEVRGAFAR